MPVPQTIVCVDCGGTCHLLTYLDPEVPPEPGDYMSYRCADCNDRWDVELTEEDLDDDIPGRGD